MKKALIAAVAAVALLTSAVPASAKPIKKDPPPPSGPITTFADPIDGGSWTEINYAQRSFSNWMENVLVGSIVAGGLEYAARYVPGGPWVTAGKSAIQGSIIAFLGAHLNTYVIFRQGISWNSYYRYYEYINAATYYWDPSFTQVRSVDYIPTGTPVPNEVLIRYGLPPLNNY